MRRYALIVAGGKGSRMGAILPKQFLPLRGKPVLMRTLEAFAPSGLVDQIIVVLPAERRPYWQTLCEEIPCKVPHVVVEGGETRFDSVRNGLTWIKGDLFASDKQALVAVHDGARPFVTQRMIEDGFRMAKSVGSAVPTIPLVDTLRKILPDGGTLPADRRSFMAVQTPQVFTYELLEKAYTRPYSPSYTDDASVVDDIGARIGIFEGDRSNLKITTPFDLRVAEAILEEREEEIRPWV